MLAPGQAAARFFVPNDAPPVVTYSIDGTEGNNGWYVGSTSGPFIVVHWSVSGSVTSTTGCEPAINVPDPDTGSTLTCTASGPGGTTSVTTKLLKVDATAPATTVTPSQAPNGAGWYRSGVTLTWSGTDSTSGIASCTAPLTYSGPDTSAVTESGTCQDNAGNWSAAPLTLHYDSTPPTTTPSPSPAPNANGWLNSPVQVSWNGTDATSGVASCSATSSYSSPDTAGTTLSGSCTDKAGNTGPASFTVKLDTGAPTTTAVPARAPNSAGWYRASIGISGSGTDSLSGIDSCTSTTYSGPDTNGTSKSVTCTDKAGNSSTGSYLVKYDSTPPSVSAATARPPDQGSWFNAPVEVDWSGTDATSGIASCSSSTYNGPDNANASVPGSCTDAAGNVTTSSLGLKYDSTPPVTTVSSSPAPNGNGWENAKPDVTWSGSDATSGIASCTPKTTYSGPETAGTAMSGTCTDNAGNSSGASFTVRYDATAPITTASPARAPNGAGWFNSAVTINGSGTDALSGIDSCTSASYGGPDTTGTSKSVSCTDKAGNTSSGSYVVKYDSTPPSVSAVPTRPPDQGSWYNKPVDVDWAGTDGTSGIASCSSLTYNGPDDANASVQGSCTDAAGNSTTTSFGLKYDSTPPVTTVSSNPAPNANGWENSKPDVTWSGSDATSGIASCTPTTTYSGPETAGTAMSGTCTDQAGNSSGASFTVRYDGTAPITTAVPARSPNGAGWFNSSVAINGSGTDGLSGIDSCTSTTYSGPDTTGTSKSVTCTDKAGNSSTGSYVVKYDSTPPALGTPTAARVPDSNGWYNHPVGVTWHGTDATSGIAGCSSPVYNAPDSPNATVHGSCTDVAGNTTASDFTFQYDSTPPTVAVSAARPPDHDGWYNQPVKIAWSGTDATSGIASCTAPVTYSGPDSSNASSGGGCTDNAGNTASPPALSFRYDSTPPAVQPVASRPPDSNGWYNHALKVDWGGTDPVSGIASCSSYSYSGPDAAAVQPSGVCTDKAGNTSAPVPFGFRFDSTPPSGVTAGPARPPDHNGWYNRPFGVTWSGSDALSGIASCTTATYGGPTNSATAMSGSCTDKAGNTSGAVGYAFKYDSTPPAFDRLSLTPHDDAVAVRWRASGATVFEVTRKPGVGGAASSVVYDGSASSFADRKVDNYVRYTYVVTAEDGAGNELARSASTTPMPVLYAPRPGARVSPGSSPVLAWRADPDARYYNVQLWLAGHAVGSWWPASSSLKLPARWRFGGSAHALEAGSYTWYVWPGRGPRSRGRYGRLHGKSTFVVGSG